MRSGASVRPPTPVLMRASYTIPRRANAIAFGGVSVRRQRRQLEEARVWLLLPKRDNGAEPASDEGPVSYDLFVSHASEDHTELAQPLALALEGAGLTVWADEPEEQTGE